MLELKGEKACLLLRPEHGVSNVFLEAYQYKHKTNIRVSGLYLVLSVAPSLLDPQELNQRNKLDDVCETLGFGAPRTKNIILGGMIFR